MFKKLLTMVAFALVSLSLLGTGCKKDEEKFCEAIRNFEKDYSDEECKKDVDGIKEDCSNADEVISCVAGTTTENAAEACMEKCKDKTP